QSTTPALQIHPLSLHDALPILKSAEQLHWVPDRGSINHYRRRGHDDTDKGIQRHSRGQSQSLPNCLLALAAGEPGKVRDIQRYRSEEHTSELQSRFDLVCRLLL